MELPTNPKLKILTLILIGLLWVTAAFAGFRAFFIFEQTEGSQGMQVTSPPEKALT